MNSKLDSSGDSNVENDSVNSIVVDDYNLKKSKSKIKSILSSGKLKENKSRDKKRGIKDSTNTNNQLDYDNNETNCGHHSGQLTVPLILLINLLIKY